MISMNVGRIDELSLELLNTVEIILKMIVRRLFAVRFEYLLLNWMAFTVSSFHHNSIELVEIVAYFVSCRLVSTLFYSSKCFESER